MTRRPSAEGRLVIWFLGLDLADMDARVLVDGFLGNTFFCTQFPEPTCDRLQ